MILRTRRALSSAARPTSPLPALLVTMVRSLALLGDERVDELHRQPGRPEAADQNRSAVLDTRDGLFR